MSFIITGCQRSGTKSAALLFNISHESQFTPYSDYNNIPNEAQLRNEVSWMAAPFISRYTTVIHLVRNPINVINSLMGIEFFANNGTNYTTIGHTIYRNFALKFTTIKLSDPLIMSVQFYLQWTSKLDDLPRIKIEDIHNAPRVNSRKRDGLDRQTLKERLPGELFQKLENKVVYYGYG